MRIILLFLVLAKLANASESKEESPIDVFADEIEVSDIYDPLSFAGIVESAEKYPAFSQVTGFLHKIEKTEGDVVRKGDVIAYVMPVTQGRIYKPHSVRASLDGIVTRFPTKQGERVETESPLAMVESTDKLILEIHVPGLDVNEFAADKAIFITVGDFRRDIYETKGRVMSVSPAADALTGTFRVRLEVLCDSSAAPTECRNKARLGSLARVTVKQNLRRGILVEASHLQKNQTEVVKIVDGLAKWTKIKLGKNYGDKIEVVSGLKVGERIVASFAKWPKEDAKLKVVTKGDDKITKKQSPKSSG